MDPLNASDGHNGLRLALQQLIHVKPYNPAVFYQVYKNAPLINPNIYRNEINSIFNSYRSALPHDVFPPEPVTTNEYPAPESSSQPVPESFSHPLAPLAAALNINDASDVPGPIAELRAAQKAQLMAVWECDEWIYAIVCLAIEDMLGFGFNGTQEFGHIPGSTVQSREMWRMQAVIERIGWNRMLHQTSKGSARCPTFTEFCESNAEWIEKGESWLLVHRSRCFVKDGDLGHRVMGAS